MKTIGFHSNQLSMTGTEVALYDYAHYNETLLGNRSVVLHHRLNPNNHPEALAKFAKRFEVLTYDHVSELDDVLGRAHADLLYAIKAGKKDGLVSKRIPTMVHAVFPTAPWQVHGSSYAFISEWLSKECSANEIPTVPHIVTMPDVDGDLRAELNIPADALVLGCYGGARSYDVPCAIEGAKHLLRNSSEIYFIFMNLIPFLEHPRAIFLRGTTDIIRKTKFINTCNAMVHARLQGESFGLACGEFSVRKKPVLTFKYGKHTHHLDILKDHGLFYGNQEEFETLIKSIKFKTDVEDCYSSRYNPERVMKLFDEYLIKQAIRTNYAKIPTKNAAWAFLFHKIR